MKEKQETLKFNCRFKTDCLHNADSRKKSVIYKCTATICNSTKVYPGLTDGELRKQRYYDHAKSLKTNFMPTERCSLCPHEKLAIFTYPYPGKLLNRQSELVTKYRHENKFLLKNFNSND